MALSTALEDFMKSIYELFASIVGTVYSIIYSTVSAVFAFIAGLFSLVGDVVAGMAKAAGGVGKFVTGKFSCVEGKTPVLTWLIGNIVLITIGALGAFAYVRYTAQGRRLAVEGKKTQ